MVAQLLHSTGQPDAPTFLFYQMQMTKNSYAKAMLLHGVFGFALSLIILLVLNSHQQKLHLML
jgi:hypothetical protein